MSAVLMTIADIFQSLATTPAVKRKLAAGETLFRAGDGVKAVYVVASGRLQLVRISAAGRTAILHRAGEGERFAEPSLFSERYHCDAVAEIATEVMAYAKADMVKGLAKDADRMMLLLRHLAGQVKTLRARAEILCLRGATQRLVAYVRLHEKSAGAVVTIKPNWKQVAAEVGLTHEALYRALAQLEREAVIQREGRKVTLRSASTER